MVNLRTLDQVLGAEIRQRREGAGLQQDTLASLARNAGLDWGQSTISAIEAGRRQVSIGELAVFARVFSEATGRADEVAAGALLPRRAEWVLLAPNVRGWLPAIRAIYGAPVADVLYSLDGPGRAIVPDRGLPAVNETDRKVARALRVTPEAVAVTAVRLWGRTLAEERDARLGDPAATAQKRGRVTRQLMAEVKPTLTRRRKKR